MRNQRIFRIFVSSTFGDFQAEREALREKVWPALQNFCRARGGDFQAVDLRWGVSESAGVEHETMKICLDEIAHCQRLSPRPNFLILVGDRYGWRPLPPAIPVTEFAEILGCFSGAPKTRAFLQEWYRQDENAVPTECVLQPRPAKYEDWAPVEARLLKLLRGAANVLGMTPERRERYFLSATHLEIVRGALSPTVVPDAERHVLAFFRTLESLPEGARLTEAKRFVDLTPANERDPEALGYLEELKAELRQRLSAEAGHVFDYPVRWTGVDPFITTDHLEAFCQDVESSLRQLIERELAEVGDIDRVEAERQAHEVFRQERGRVFVGREAPLASIAAYLAEVAEEQALPEEDSAIKAEDDSEEGEECADGQEVDEDEVAAPGLPPLVIHGPGGTGKSALMARAMAAAHAAHPEAVVVQRFIGASPASVSLRALLSGLCQEIARAYEQSEALPEDDMKKLMAAFAERLGSADAERPLFVFIDALDQLVSQDGVQPFEWLPSALPPYTRLVASVLDGPAWTELQQRRPDVLEMAMPAVSAEEAEAMLDALLADATPTQPARRLTPAQRLLLLQRPGARFRPLWLKLAVIEAKRWRSYQDLAPLEPTTPKLLHQFFTRLQTTHGPLLVERALAYLATSRHGLNDDEMRAVLWRDGGVQVEFNQRKNPDQPPVTALPPIVWSRLYFDLEPYLIERAAEGTNCYAFYHRQFGDAVQTAFLSDRQRLARHRQLAAYFRDCGARAADRRPQLRTLAELPWQQTQAGQASEVEQTLTDFDFAMAKCEAGLHLDLIKDYRRALAIMQPPSQTFRVWENFFRSRRHILDRANPDWPTHKILLQLAVEHADESPVTQAAERWLEQGYCDWVWLRNPQRIKLEEEKVKDIELLPDRQLLLSGDKLLDPCTVLLEGEEVQGIELLPNGRVLSWGEKLRIWDLESERCEVEEDAYTWGIQVLANGQILSWCRDDIWIRDSLTGVCQTVLRVHTESIDGVQELADGRILSWSYDYTLRLWDRVTGVCQTVLKGHTAFIKGAQELADGRILSWSGDKTLRLWDSLTGVCQTVLKGHTGGVEGVRILANGRIVSWPKEGTIVEINKHKNEFRNVSAFKATILATLAAIKKECMEEYNDGCNKKDTDEDSDSIQILSRTLVSIYSLRVWDSMTGVCQTVLRGHTDSINGVQELADGRILSWSGDKTLRLWDSLTGVCQTVLKGHTAFIKGAQELADGRILSWSGDKTLRLWDSLTGVCQIVLKGHTAFIKGAQELADGRILSWSGDKTLRLWDSLTGVCQTVLKGHIDSIDGVQELADGRILSWSEFDRTLRLWNGMIEEVSITELPKHASSVKGVLELEDDKLLTWSDHDMQIWIVKTGEFLIKLKDYRIKEIKNVKILNNDRILSIGDSIGIFDIKNGNLLTLLKYEYGFNDAQLLASGHLLSWSSLEYEGACDDQKQIVQIWDLNTSECLSKLIFDGSSCFRFLSNNYLLCWSYQRSEQFNLFDVRDWFENLDTSKKYLHKFFDYLKNLKPDVKIILFSNFFPEINIEIIDTQQFYDNLLIILAEGSDKSYLILLDLIKLKALDILEFEFTHFKKISDIKIESNHFQLYLNDCFCLLHEKKKFFTNKVPVIYNRSKLEEIGFFNCQKFMMCESDDASDFSVRIRNDDSNIIAYWHGKINLETHKLLPDGTLVVSLSNGCVFFLKLYYGNKRIELNDLLSICMDSGKSLYS